MPPGKGNVCPCEETGDFDVVPILPAKSNNTPPQLDVSPQARPAHLHQWISLLVCYGDVPTIGCKMVETFMNSLVLICLQTFSLTSPPPYIKFICLTNIAREGERGNIRESILDLMTQFSFHKIDCLNTFCS